MFIEWKFRKNMQVQENPLQNSLIRCFEFWMGFSVFLNVFQNIIFSGLTSFCVKVHVCVRPTIGIFHVKHKNSR